MTGTPTPSSDRELVISRIIAASRDKVYHCWAEPELIKQWFAPRPRSTQHAETDVRPGGANLVAMKSPEGQEFPNRGVYLEVVPNERLVITDAYNSAWQPSNKPFFTAVLTFEKAGHGRTMYTACARHWTVKAMEEHKKMGFHDGWMKCAEQLEEVGRRL